MRIISTERGYFHEMRIISTERGYFREIWIYTQNVDNIHGTWIFPQNADNIHGMWIFPRNVDISTIISTTRMKDRNLTYNLTPQLYSLHGGSLADLTITIGRFPQEWKINHINQ